MEHILVYTDESLDIILEVHSKRLTKDKLNETIEHYRKYGFYGQFKQEKCNG